MEKTLKIVGKVVAYTVFLLVLTFSLFRGAVSTLWGSHSDFGLIAAPLVGVMGFLGLLWLAMKLVKDIINTK